jgi:hypothetical protein
MRNACIEVVDLPYIPSTIASTQMQINFTLRSENVSTIIAGNKDCPVNSSPEFWYARVIAANSVHITGGTIGVNKVKKVNGKVTEIISTIESNPYNPNDRVLGMRMTAIADTVFVFNHTITTYAGKNHPKHTISIDNGPNIPYVYPSTATMKKDTLLHEIIHLFGILDNQKGSDGNYIYDIMCYTWNSDDGPTPVIVDENIQKIQQRAYPQ